MLCGAPALEHVIELRIVAHSLVADQQLRAGGRVFRHQRFDERDDGILCGSDTEQDFAARIIELERRTQRIGGIIVYSA